MPRCLLADIKVFPEFFSLFLTGLQSTFDLLQPGRQRLQLLLHDLCCIAASRLGPIFRAELSCRPSSRKTSRNNISLGLPTRNAASWLKSSQTLTLPLARTVPAISAKRFHQGNEHGKRRMREAHARCVWGDLPSSPIFFTKNHACHEMLTS